MMGAIQDVKKTIASIEAEITAIRKELNKRRQEIGPLRRTTDPAKESERAALAEVITRLEQKLTTGDHEPDSNTPSLAFRLYTAKMQLSDLRQKRKVLAADIERVEKRAAIITAERYAKAMAGVLELDRLMRDCQLLDSNAPLRDLIAARAWLARDP